MERIHSNSSILPNMAAKNSATNPTTSTTTAERLLAGIMDPFPTWDMNPGMMASTGSNNASSPPSNNDIMFNNFMCPIEAPNIFGMSPFASAVRYTKLSPQSNSSSIGCACGEENAVIRCLDCNEFMCEDCERQHRNSPLSSNHSTISLPTPIGTSPTGSLSSCTPSHQSLTNYMCDLHNEMLRYVCEFCKKLVCQCCTLREHKEHNYASIEHFVDDAKDNIESAIESSRMGTRCIKGSIDKALAFIRLTERNCNELSDNIRKGFRQFLITIEDRERFLLDLVEKLRQRRLAVLHEQMAGLKSALSGLSETSDMLHKVAQNTGNMDYIEIAMKVTNGQRQLEQFAAIYKDLQPKQEVFAFAPPDYSLLQDIRNQGTIISVDEKNMPIVNGAIAGADMGLVMPMPVPNTGLPVALVATNPRRAIHRESAHRIPSPILPQLGPGATALPNPGLEWELSVRRHSPGLLFGAPRITQAIPGSIEHVRARNSNALTQSFATEGQEDGEVSRPWGVCVDKLGQILVSDRRNNRVQVFKSNGALRFKFGTKGPGNGEFDLPAGICVDIDNRIIVVDKDNHRVQIFTSTGVFLNKFGSYGKEYGQFQYPWDVAVNSRRQIVVTDSRNHRIQQFDSEGRFIRQIVFDNHELNKGIASPRGVCYTPTGNVIVSDFDNHCLYLIDPDKNEILSVKGQEGAGFQEFNRPSGLCCDDDGRIIVADSKNQRVVVFSPSMDYLWDIEIRPSVNPLMPRDLDEKDRTCDVALMPDGRIVFLIELSPDSKEGSNPYKTFVQVY